MAGSGLRYTRNNGKVGGESYLQMARDMKKILEDELDVAGREGAEFAQRYVDTSGTNRTWAAPWGGRSGSGAGRVDSGEMRDALDYRIVRGQNVGLDVGWIHIWQRYFSAQDEGFTAGGARPNQAIEGMGVMAHLRTLMRDSVDKQLDRATKRILDGL